MNPPQLSDAAATDLLRLRRTQWFFTDVGPDLPAGTSAAWRVTADDPQGWQANAVGAIAAPPALLGAVLDQAQAFFAAQGADAWVEVQEHEPLWAARHLLGARGWTLHDDWDVLLCRTPPPPPPSPATLQRATAARDLRWAAWIAEQNERSEPLSLTDPAVTRRLERYLFESTVWQTVFLVARVAGRPVGCARLTAEELPVIVGVATLPVARGRGVAAALTAALTARALRQRPACALYVERGSQAARIYARLGYQPLFRIQNWVWRYPDRERAPERAD